MDIYVIILLSVGLAMDCFAVSLAKGLASRAVPQWPWAVLMALFFGIFQGAMPLLGFFAGVHFSDFFSRWSPWIALLLLGFIGGKMIAEGLHSAPALSENSSSTAQGKISVFSLGELFVLAVATSIDALAVGTLFVPVPESLWIGAAIIALGSLLFSLCGYAFGCFAGSRFRLNAEVTGGLILIGIGLKIFIEHYL